jgi:hypothetical protein
MRTTDCWADFHHYSTRISAPQNWLSSTLRLASSVVLQNPYDAVAKMHRFSVGRYVSLDVPVMDVPISCPIGKRDFKFSRLMYGTIPGLPVLLEFSGNCLDVEFVGSRHHNINFQIALKPSSLEIE